MISARDDEQGALRMAEPQLDKLRPWSPVKHLIVQKYIRAYSRIIARQPKLRHVYVDAFAGAGMLRNVQTGAKAAGSPIIALDIKPAFHEYHFIERDESRARMLRQHVGARGTVYTGDCNDLLLNCALPLCRWREHRRGFWLLDAYGMDYDWRVIAAAGAEKGVEILLNWPIHDINRNAAWRNPSKLDDARLERMRRFWGDDSWRDVAYVKQFGLFGGEPTERKLPYTRIVEAYRDRLKNAVGFPFVPDPLLVRGDERQPLYYLVFASHNSTGEKIARDVFRRHATDADRGSLPDSEEHGC